MKDVTPNTSRDAVTKYLKIAIGLVVVIAIAGVAYTVKSHYNEKNEMEAQTALFKAELTFENTFKEAQKKIEHPADAKKNPKKKEEEKSVNFSDVDFSKAMDLYRKVIAEYPKSDAALLAAHGLSTIYVEKKQFKEALDALKQVNGGDKDDLISALTRLKMSGLYEKVGQCDESLKILNSIASDKRYDYLKPEVLLKTGICYERLGQADKAKEVYTQITREFSNSMSSQEAEKYLKLLTLNKG